MGESSEVRPIRVEAGGVGAGYLGLEIHRLLLGGKELSMIAKTETKIFK